MAQKDIPIADMSLGQITEKTKENIEQHTCRPLSNEGNGTIADSFTSWSPTVAQGLEPASAYNVRWAVRKISLWVGDLQLSKFSASTLVNIQDKH